MSFQPFADESATLNIGGITLENHMDHIAVFGQLALTKDEQGLALALTLQKILDDVVRALQASALPAHIESKPVVMVNNPFT